MPPALVLPDSKPKYSLFEIERRWLVDATTVEGLGSLPHREIEDRYLRGSRLRLRRITSPEGPPVFKLGKKYGKGEAYSEPVTTLYLTDEEHRLLSALPCSYALKRRYSVFGGALDVYVRPQSGLALFEVEFEDEASAALYKPPPFAVREVTHDLEFSGASISKESLQ